MATAPTRPDHTILGINCSWAAPEEVGQFWERSVARVIIS
jgi:hypothetical protein